MKNKNILLRAERDGQFRALMDWGPKLKPDFYKLQVLHVALNIRGVYVP